MPACPACVLLAHRVSHSGPGVRPVVSRRGLGWWCDGCMAARAACHSPAGCLQASRVGAGNAGSGASNAYDARRTSSSMLVDPGVRRQHAELAGIMDELQRRAWELLLQGEAARCRHPTPPHQRRQACLRGC
jgi:hypothetical protein